MSWLTAPLASIAPRQAMQRHLFTEQNLWHPKLSHIESQTGRILLKEYENSDPNPNPSVYFDKGNVLLGKYRPESSKVTIADEAGFGGNEWIALRPETRVLDPQYLAFYLRSSAFRQQAMQRTIGTVIPRIAESWLSSHAIPLPPLREQRHIVAMMDKANHLLQLQRKTNRNVQTVLRAQYLKMFGDPTTNPKQLQKVRLGDVLEWQIGKPLAKSAMQPSGVYPTYGGRANMPRAHDWLCDAKSIILTRVGPHCGAVHYTREKAWVTTNAMYLQKKHVAMEDRYLLTALVLAKLGRIGGSATAPILTTRQLQETEILLPDLCQQQQFAHFADKIAAIEQQQAKAGLLLASLWEKLVAQAFSGQLTAKWHQKNSHQLDEDMMQQAQFLKAYDHQKEAI
jgi:type I restriction enzyme S subunit